MKKNHNEEMAAHGGEVFRLAAKKGILPNKIIDFSANINPLGLPPGVYSVLLETLQNLANYPEIDAASMRSVVAKRHNLDVKNVIVGNGSSALIYLLTRVLKPKKSLIWSPTFTEYERSLKQIESKVKNLNCLNPDKKFNIDDIIKLTIEIKPEMVFLCNPNNPTGCLWSIKELDKILSTLQSAGIICVLDEAFIDFVGEQASFANRVEEFENLIVLRSLTKIFALAGIRCGYLLSSRLINKQIAASLEPWSINSLALKAAVTALENGEEFINNTRVFIDKERKNLKQKLNQLNFLKSYPSCANYILTKVSNNIDCGKLQDYLFSEHNILIRLCGDYPGLGNNYVRFAVKDEKDNCKLIEGLSAYQCKYSTLL